MCDRFTVKTRGGLLRGGKQCIFALMELLRIVYFFLIGTGASWMYEVFRRPQGTNALEHAGRRKGESSP